MELQNQLRLSYYQKIADIDTTHNVCLVQHTISGKIFIKKKLSIYDMDVFLYIDKNTPEGVPRIEELIQDENSLYIIEEYISGTSLQDILTEKKTFSEEKAVEYILRICNILKPFHQQDPPIVHRDIKPSNIIITPDDRLILVDFNSAKEYHKEKTQDTVLFGTAGYAAPEQYGFSPSSPSADIYALGVLLHKMLTGRLPNETKYTGTLYPVIKKCLQMEPKNRYNSVTELVKSITKLQKPKLSKNICFKSKIKSFALPGFRSKKLYFIIPSILWYLFLIFISALLTVENVTGVSLIIYRICFSLTFFSLTLWLGNYKGVWNYFPICCNKNIIIRMIGVIIFSFIWFF